MSGLKKMRVAFVFRLLLLLLLCSRRRFFLLLLLHLSSSSSSTQLKMAMRNNRLNRVFGGRSTAMRTRVDALRVGCGANVAILCYRSDGNATLFHGHPSSAVVVDRYVAANPLPVAVATQPQAVAAQPQIVAGALAQDQDPVAALGEVIQNIDVDGLTAQELLAFEAQLLPCLILTQARLYPDAHPE